MRFNQNSQNRISLLGVCSGLGQKHKGLELTPQLLRDEGLCQVLTKNGSELIDLGDLKPYESEDRNGWNLIERVRTVAFDSLQNGDLLFSIGGDHSISIATVQATLMTYPNARVIWVDAHGDMNTPKTSSTGNLHGMPLAALMGLFKSPVSGPLLSPRKLLVVGVRDLDPAEQLFFEDLNIQCISAKEITLNSLQALTKLNLWLKKDVGHPIHVSLDVDALDPSVAPATGIRVPMGLSVEFVNGVLSLVTSQEKIVAVDLVEMNPLKAENAHELEKTIQSVKSILSNISPHTNRQIDEQEIR